MAKPIENETVRIIDLVFIMKDAEDNTLSTSSTSWRNWPPSTRFKAAGCCARRAG
jgi:hypothetical protein